MRRHCAVLLLAACLLAAACDDGLDDHRRDGELGNGAFYYLCVDDTDIACDEAGYATFPATVGSVLESVVGFENAWRTD